MVSPKHTVRGEKEFRRMAYREGARYGLSFRQRETVAKLIRYHGLPVWFWTKKRPDFNLLEAAECVPLRLLFLLSFADVQGREADLAGGLSGQVELFADYAKELDVWEHPYAFSGAYTKFRYFQKESLWQGTDLYDGLEFDVTVMSGLPLSGKDTWIGKNGGNLPVVSLDDIRAEMGIPPAKGSGRVVQEALGAPGIFCGRRSRLFGTPRIPCRRQGRNWCGSLPDMAPGCIWFIWRCLMGNCLQETGKGNAISRSPFWRT